MEILNLYETGLLKNALDSNKMKLLVDYIMSLPKTIIDGDNMNQLISYIKTGDNIMINESISELNWLQKHVVLALFKCLNKTRDREELRKEMNIILPTIMEKWEMLCKSSDCR